MSGVSDVLFGSKPSVSSTSTLTGGQNDLLDSLIKAINGSIFTPEGGIAGKQGYTGDLTAGPSAIQQNLFDKIPGLLGGDPTANTALTKFLSDYSGGYKSQSFDPTSTLNLFQDSVYNPAMRSFQEDVLPQIAEKFAGRGSFDSGGTMFDMTKAGTDLMSNLSGTKASMLDSAKNNWDSMELNKFLNINSLLPNVASGLNTSKLSGLPYAMELGGTQQGLDQAELTEMFNKWQTEQPYNNPYLQLMNLALGVKAVEPVANQGSTGLMSSLLPALGTAAGGFLSSSAGSTALASLLAS